MMVAPASGNRKVEFVAPRTLESPAILLHGTFEHVDGMGNEGWLVLVRDCHQLLRFTTATQREAVMNQTGTRFCSGTRVRLHPSWDGNSHSQLWAAVNRICLSP